MQSTSGAGNSVNDSSPRQPRSRHYGKRTPYVQIAGVRLQALYWDHKTVTTQFGEYDTGLVSRFSIDYDRDTYLCPGNFPFDIRWRFIRHYTVEQIESWEDPVYTIRKRWRRLVKNPKRMDRLQKNPFAGQDFVCSEKELIQRAKNFYVKKRTTDVLIVGEDEAGHTMCVHPTETTWVKPEGPHYTTDTDSDDDLRVKSNSKLVENTTETASGLSDRASADQKKDSSDQTEELVDTVLEEQAAAIKDLGTGFRVDHVYQAVKQDEEFVILLPLYLKAALDADKYKRMLNSRLKFKHDMPECMDKTMAQALVKKLGGVYENITGLYMWSKRIFWNIARMTQQTARGIMEVLMWAAPADGPQPMTLKEKTEFRDLLTRDEEEYDFDNMPENYSPCGMSSGTVVKKKAAVIKKK